jgi:hypothetical protein
MIRPKSLARLSCLAAADNGQLTDEILRQPDYRELMHRTLPEAEQIKLLGESCEYNSDGMIVKRNVYDSHGKKIISWFYDRHRWITYTSYSETGTRLSITFRDDLSIARIGFINPTGAGFQLSTAGFDMHVELFLRNTPHGISQYRTCMIEHQCRKHDLGTVKCLEGVFDKYILHYQGTRLGCIHNNLELD